MSQDFPNTPKPKNHPLTGVIHDMNQLFGVIIGRTSKLLAANPDPNLETDLKAILLAAKDATAMAQRLRGAPAGGQDRGNFEPLAQVVAQAVLLAASDEDRRKWPVAVDVPDDLVAAVPDQVVREVLNNLLRNAQAAMPDGGRISVRASLTGDNVQLLVQDRGPGLSSDIASQIFDMGFTTSGDKDKGVGLPASRALVQSGGGDLKFIPTPEGGALFELELPVGELAVSSEPAGNELVEPSWRDIAILVVDDDQAMREMLSDVLGSLGCDVVVTRDATSALEIMAANRFQIAMVDQNLPGMKGTDLAHELRVTDPLLTLILITGWGNEELEFDPDESALDLLARKPLEFGAIKDLIGQGINIRREKEQPQPKESGQ